ncbi:Ger(x)C family spore germination protein [Paenibacillus sp. HB172176]|uniref:Ger(x)C family spore germination protein n=1 Tax=Paenibacillus sp. HB172176 TaxID=2493690 RepID=UPI00143ADF06|nr:Ger(x)C family spore germination protein [Paenibacillus sp. HB172176]
MNLIARISLPLLMLFMVAGCGFKDIDKRFFVVNTGIDWSGNKDKPYRITIQLAIPSPKIEPGTSKNQYETIDAPTIAEGIRMLKAYVDKELDFGHCKLFVIGDGMAKQDIRPVINWMLRRRDIQNGANVAIGEPTAKDILNIHPPSERYPGNALLLSFGTDGTESSYTYVETISGLERRLTEDGLDPILPVITTDGKESFIINRIALFDKQRLKLSLPPADSQLFTQLSNHFTKSSMHGMFKGDKIVSAINSFQSSFHIQHGAEPAQIRMKVKMKVVFEEAPDGLFNQSWAPLEKQLGEEYEQTANKLLRKIQQAGLDPFGFGLRYRAYHPGENNWKKWKDLYPDANLSVKAQVKVEGTGLIK